MAYRKKDWWHVDADGRRIGWLWPEDIAAILEGFYGPKKWVNGFCAHFGYSRSTVDRWVDGTNPIPKDTAQIINMLGTFKIRNIPFSDIEAGWLPPETTGKAVSSDDDEPPKKRKPANSKAAPRQKRKAAKKTTKTNKKA